MCANNLFKTQAIKLLKYIRFTCFIISPPRLFFGSSYDSPDMLFMRFFSYVCFKGTEREKTLFIVGDH